ncbi:alpha/beta hydrolase [Nocardioides sp. zg-DK7169]|uniref:alpha/beta hydrolase n=1 Tax=Nocardioides sp. zg-DK7169 TaxID=2736600 RepID=UPI0015543EC3|nr:alpha/beta hydrolase [Nocardioides sp. zg-DK7169]NPC96651.1 alpha/beta hydrolase [Nocardioides sp. zg-DK7169]
MRSNKRALFAGLLAAGTMLSGLVGLAPTAQAAEQACHNYSSSSSTCVNTQLRIDGTSHSVDWYLPNTSASALMVLNHGFSRGCGNLRGTSKAIAEKGVMVLCVNGDMTAGNPELAADLGDLLTSRAVTPPAGKALPSRYIVGGHSAGGHFASALGARLDANGYGDLAGAILFDPVASGGFTANLEAISDGGAREVLAVTARPSITNLFNNSAEALVGLDNPYVGLQLVWEKFTLGMPVGGSCHIDVEGENTDLIGIAGAGCSANTTQTARLRDFGSTWAKDLATGTRTAAYYCTDAAAVSTCGTKVKDLVDRTLPLAAPIR